MQYCRKNQWSSYGGLQRDGSRVERVSPHHIHKDLPLYEFSLGRGLHSQRKLLITVKCVTDATSIASTKKPILDMGAVNYTKLLFLGKMS